MYIKRSVYFFLYLFKDVFQFPKKIKKSLLEKNKRKKKEKRKKMLNEENEIDWYEILNCSIESTKEEIERAARFLSRKYHPDRNKEIIAKEIFLKIQKAKDFLLDDKKREEYDKNMKLKIKRKEYDEKRYKHMNNKRKKMREDLEEKVGNVNKSTSSSMTSSSSSTTTTNSTQQNQSNLTRKNVNDIRQDSINRMNEAQMQQESNYNHISEEEILQHRKSMVDSTNQLSIVQIKVKWKRSDISHSDDSLHSLFRTFGAIEDIAMSVGGKTNTAIITFESHNSAQAAVTHYLDSKQLRVTLLTNETKKPSIFTHTYQNTGTTTTTNINTNTTSSSFSSSTTSTTNIGSNNESDLMREVRRAVEREELLNQMAASSFSSIPLGNNISINTNSHNNPTSSSSSSNSISNSSIFSTSTLFPQQQQQQSSTTNSTPSVNLATRENDILARMMAAKSAKSSSSSATASASAT